MTRSRILTIFSAAAIFLLCTLIPAYLNAEEVTDSDFGYSLDIPEGFNVSGYTPDGMSYHFKHSFVPVDFVLKLYEKDVFPDSNSALKGALKKLNADYEGTDTFTWDNTGCSISNFSSNAIAAEGVSGWAVAATLPDNGANLVLLCYADSSKAKNCEQFILSTLNSLCISKKSRFSPGIITSYAYQQGERNKIRLNIGGRQITTEIDSSDSEANNFVIECEFEILKLYANHEKWKEAWIRYYRAIFRDSYSRLSKAAFDINSAIYQAAVKRNPESPENAMNEMLLNWVQSFEYRRGDKKSTDFTSVIDALSGTGSDCDSRSMLMCILLKQNGINATLFISREYSHAVYGAQLNAEGAKINVNGKDFLLGETTVKNLKPGLIAQEQNDTEKWIPVTFE